MDADVAQSQPIDLTLKPYIEAVEKDLLDHVLKALQARQIPAEEAQKLAQDFLKELPPHDREDLLENLQAISQMHPIARDTYLKFANEAHKEERVHKLRLTAHHLSNGDIDSALQVVKVGQNG